MKRQIFTSIILLLVIGCCYSQVQIKRKKAEKTGQVQSSSQKQNHTQGQKNNSLSVKVSEPDGYINGYGYVDLGLPSGIKWATCNVGASTTSEYGNYYAWGETTTKNDYSHDTCIHERKNKSNLKSEGIIDTNGNLTPAYDAATANWGNRWRMPTNTEFEELIKFCSIKLTTYKGIHGCHILGLNGKSIFLPAAGCRCDSSLDGVESYGDYWTSTPSVLPGIITFTANRNSGLGSAVYWCGRSVRAISE